MILSKANLTICNFVTPQDGDLGVLHIAEDGTTVAVNRQSILVCSPSNSENPFTVKDARTPAVGVSVRVGVAQQVIRSLPKDRVLQIACLSQADEERVEFVTANQQQEQRITGMPIFKLFPEWRDVLRRLWQTCKPFRRVAVSKHALMHALKVMDKASEDRSKVTPVYLEISEGKEAPLILRMRNYATQQDLVSVLPVMKVAEKNSQYSIWERLIFGIRKRFRPRRIQDG